MPVNLLGGSHLLQALGLDNDYFYQQLDAYRDQTDFLHELRDQFERTGGAMPPLSLASLLQSGAISTPGYVPLRNQSGCNGYAQSQTVDFGASAAPPWSFEAMSQRQQGAQFERYLYTNPFARQQFEMAMGGRIVPDGRADGRITIQPFAGGYFPAGGGNSYASAMQMFAGMNRAASSAGYQQGMNQGLYMGMMMGAFASMLQGRQAQRRGHSHGGASPYVDWGGPGGPPPGYMPGGNNMFGYPYTPGGASGSYMPGAPGTIGDTNGVPTGNDVNAVMNDSSLTVEDKVCLMIMMIMKQMDKEIEDQANYVNQLQQQQNKQGKGGAKGKGGGGSDKSIDVETMKLKRLIDKRSQMFDMLRQIIDKYNQTAKGIIDSMR
jgi:hypothetical protein